jgi:hypothetical protein
MSRKLGTPSTLMNGGEGTVIAAAEPANDATEIDIA